MHARNVLVHSRTAFLPEAVHASVTASISVVNLSFICIISALSAAICVLVPDAQSQIVNLRQIF
jgi:hypothetical protein